MAQELKSETVINSIVNSPPARLSYEEFLVLYDGVSAEWVNGVVILMSPASQKHQALSGFLTALLMHFVEANQLGEVLSAPFQMKIEVRPS